jgi:hypothetical protein
MKLNSNQLKKIMNEEYLHAKRYDKLHEGTQFNPIQVSDKLIKRIIIEESFKIMQSQDDTIQLTPQMLRQMIMQESLKLGR